MALPTTGKSYQEIVAPGLNPLAIRKGVVTEVFMRDYRQQLTSLADPAVGLHTDGYFAPYSLDGQVRDDLLRLNPDGSVKTDANLGFWHLGNLGKDGISYDPNMKMEQVPTAQSLRPARVDITEEAETFEIVALEQTPLIRYIVNELPLINVPDLGTANLTIPKPMEAGIVERQVILFGFDGEHRFARTVPRCAKTNVAEFKWQREGQEGTGVKITFMILPCPYVGKPVLEHFEGTAWRGLGGYPVFPAPAPVATAVASAKATVEFTEATGRADPFSYVIYKTNGSTGVRTVAAYDTGYPQTAAGEVTAQVTGVTAAVSWTFDVEGVGSNGLKTVSLISNAVTGLA